MDRSKSGNYNRRPVRPVGVDNTLSHHGIKGMRWGVRRKLDSGGSSGSPGGAPHLPTSEDAARAAEAQRKVKSGGTKVLNTKELQDMVTRMNLERQYSQILAQKPSTFQRGHETVKKILAVGKTAQEAYQLYNSPMVKDLSKLLMKAAKTKAAVS